MVVVVVISVLRGSTTRQPSSININQREKMEGVLHFEKLRYWPKKDKGHEGRENYSLALANLIASDSEKNKS